MAKLYDITVTESMSGTDKFIVIVDGRERLITKENLEKILPLLTAEQKNQLSKIVTIGDGTRVLSDNGTYTDAVNYFDRSQFNKNSSGKIELIDYHTHDNLTNVLNKFTADDDGNLFFDGNEIGAYILPTASTTELGGVKVDGTTITINSDGVISGSANYELPTASTSTLGGVKIDGDTIKINNGIISADIINNWSVGTSYPVGYFCVYNNKLYQCTAANSDTEFTESNWILIGSSNSGTAINEWIADTEYAVGDLIIKENILYKCSTAHTSGTEFDSTNWTVLTGEKGDKGDAGNDGYSPAITSTNIDGGVILTITNADGENSITIYNGANGADGTNGTNGTDGADGITPTINSENKHWMIGETDTGIIAEGRVEINADCAVLYATFTAANWSDTEPYTQTVTVSSITANNIPIVDIHYSDDSTLWENEEVAYSCISKIETIDGGIIGTCFKEKPTSDFTVKLRIAGDVTGLTFVTQDEFDTLYSMINSSNSALENTLNGGDSGG